MVHAVAFGPLQAGSSGWPAKQQQPPHAARHERQRVWFKLAPGRHSQPAILAPHPRVPALRCPHRAAPAPQLLARGAPVAEAARRLGYGTTCFKKRLREAHGLGYWPARQVSRRLDLDYRGSEDYSRHTAVYVVALLPSVQHHISTM